MSASEDWRRDKGTTERFKYMFDNQIGCDISFNVGEEGRQVRAHKFVLVSRSAVFEAMFCGDLAETGDDIPVPDIEEDVFLDFLKYMYISEIDLSEESTLPFLYAGKKYCVEDLVEECVQFLEKQMNVDNVCMILQQAHVYDEEVLKDFCLKFICNNGKAVLSSSGFMELCEKCVEMVTECDSLSVEEDVVYEALVKWAEHECVRRNIEADDENKRKALGQLFYLIRFPVMPPDYYTNTASKQGLLTDSEKILLFQYIFGTDKSYAIPFPSAKREDAINRCFRFPTSELTSEIQAEDGFNRSVFGIVFRTSDDITVRGLILFGHCGGNTGTNERTMNISISKYGEKTESFDVELNGIEIPPTKTFDLYFDKPVSLKKGVKYLLLVRVDAKRGGYELNCITYSGRNGQAVVQNASIKFEFFTHGTMSMTTVEKGQIAGLLYSRS